MDLSKLVAYELSGDDIKSALGTVKIVEYPDLIHYDDINDVFDDNGRCVLFLEVNKVGSSIAGHWQCMTLNIDDSGQKVINFFDSYGLAPAAWNKYVPVEIQNELKEVAGRLLVPLLKKAYFDGYKVFYNNVKLQQMAGDVNTCGDYCVTRLKNNKMDNKTFIDFLDNLKKNYNVPSYDDAVAEYVYNLIGK